MGKRSLLLENTVYNTKEIKEHEVFGKEGYCYMERRIKLTPDEVKHFVAVTSKCDFDIDISYNRYVVDAKSFLGVYGLDFTKVLTVHYNGYDEELEKLLTDLAIAC